MFRNEVAEHFNANGIAGALPSVPGVAVTSVSQVRNGLGNEYFYDSANNALWIRPALVPQAWLGGIFATTTPIAPIYDGREMFVEIRR